MLRRLINTHPRICNARRLCQRMQLYGRSRSCYGPAYLLPSSPRARFTATYPITCRVTGQLPPHTVVTARAVAWTNALPYRWLNDLFTDEPTAGRRPSRLLPPYAPGCGRIHAVHIPAVSLAGCTVLPWILQHPMPHDTGLLATLFPDHLRIAPCYTRSCSCRFVVASCRFLPLRPLHIRWFARWATPWIT